MENLNLRVQKMRDFFKSGATLNVKDRKQKLIALKNAIVYHKEEIFDALKKDLNKSEYESYMTEVLMTLGEINYLIKNLAKFSKNKKVKLGIETFSSYGVIRNEPFGTVLIMSPWNYPFSLTMIPLASAIGAGNCAVVKPSNYSTNTSLIIQKIIGEVFDPSYVFSTLGGRERNAELLEIKFDKIFFTGSPSVGVTVLEKAAKNLTPAVLELGGKSPCIICDDADIEIAAKRVAFGKFLNSGQTCVAPDYCVVHKNVKTKFLSRLIHYVKSFYYDADNKILESYPKIISQRHYERLKNLFDKKKAILGGTFDDEKMIVEPVILDDVSFLDKIMEEEIFGPILPVIDYTELESVLKTISDLPKPLALYVFSKDNAKIERVLSCVQSGGASINDTIMHLSSSKLPFGGVGQSGMGNYHGKFGFDAFTHKRSVLIKKNFEFKFRYPPFKNKSTKIFDIVGKAKTKTKK